MAKTRKTRKQKLLADLHRKSQMPIVPSASSAFVTTSVILPEIVSAPYAIIAASNQAFVARDLKKTLVVTLTIVAFEVVLLLLLKSQIISIPNLWY